MTAGVSLEWRKRRKSALAPAGALTGSSHEFLQVDRSLSRQRPRGSSTPPSIFISSAGTTEREKSCFCLFLSDTVRAVGVLTLIVRRQEIGVPSSHPPFSLPIFSLVGAHAVLTGSRFPKRFVRNNVMATRSHVDLRQISAGRFVLPCLAPFWLQYERQKQAGS
jgi:hypothetical protein